MERDRREISSPLAKHGARIAARKTFSSLTQAQVDPTFARALIDSVVGEMGRLHVLVMAVGLFEHPEHGLQGMARCSGMQLGTNRVGPANVSSRATRRMMESDCVSIVNVSSRGAFRGEPDAQGASKADPNTMSRFMAKDLVPRGIFVYVVDLGFFQTGIAEFVFPGREGEAVRRESPLGHIARPGEVARAVLFPASDGADFRTGCILDANGASYPGTGS